MGRPYAQEIGELADTYGHALRTPIDELASFVGISLGSPLRAVGSGGSATACVLASVLHEQASGMVARHATPLDLLDASVLPSTSVLLVSAGGNNKDILAAFDHMNRGDSLGVGVLCSSGGRGKLSKLCASKPGVWLHDTEVPNRDGFLATNSLLAACVWLARAYGRYVPGPSLPSNLSRLLCLGEVEVARTTAGFKMYLEDLLGGMADVSTIVVLHDAAGKPAATDLESKLVESGVRNVQPADYRNFAHGRHNWLDKHVDTGVIMLTSPGCKGLAARTLDLLPSRIPAVSLSTWLEGPAAMLSLLVQCMCAVDVLGEQSGIDPGRPGVADFGRKLYGLGPF